MARYPHTGQDLHRLELLDLRQGANGIGAQPAGIVRTPLLVQLVDNLPVPPELLPTVPSVEPDAPPAPAGQGEATTPPKTKKKRGPYKKTENGRKHNKPPKRKKK